MANPWSIPVTGWAVILIGWLLVPIFSLLVNKLFTYLIFDTSKELPELEFVTIPALQATLRVVEEKRMMGAARDGSSRSDLERLDKMDTRLKSALCQAEDILDLVNYHQIEKEVTGDSSCWGLQGLLHDAGACIACWMGTLIPQSIIDITPAPLLQLGQSMKQKLGQLFISLRNSGVLLPVSQATSTVGVQMLHGWCSQIVANITSCCRSLLRWCTDRIADARYYRDWSYEQVSFKINEQKDGNVPITERIRLRKQIKSIEDILISSNKSNQLNQSSSSTAKDDGKESSSSSTVKNGVNESNSKQKEIDELYRVIGQEVFGRDNDRADTSRMLREGPDTYAASSSTSKPYSVIGIYGITGSGKTTLAQYVCDYEKGVGHFNPIMFIHVGKTFSVGDIFRDMIVQITQQRPSDTNANRSPKTELKDLKSLKAELEKELKDKCFLLVLDDLWVNDDKWKEREILLEVLGQSGGRILVTAQKKDAAAGLGAQQQIQIPDLEEEQYLSMFMHYALDVSEVTCTDYERYKAIGRKITEKLRRSPIAARTVAARLQSNNSIGFWETTANLDMLNETIGALWWSYQQLGADVRRCFAYCSTFPNGYVLNRDELVRIWIAQGFVNTRSKATEELEDVGQSYFDQLLTFSFLQTKRILRKEFTIHDLLHELAERVCGRDFFRIGLKDSVEDIPQGVHLHHLFIETKDLVETAEKLVMVENLHTLIIKVSLADPLRRNHDSEKLLERLFIRLTKLRVLIIKQNGFVQELSVPACIDRMKHLRYLCLRFHGALSVLILPSTFSKLYHIEVIDIPLKRASRPEAMANLVYLRHIPDCLYFPNIRRLTSLRTMGSFTVKEEQGYGLKQLKHLNKLGGTLRILGLGIVGSKEEALEAHLTHKERLRELKLDFGVLPNKFGPDAEAEVLEGLCPPKDIKELHIESYRGSRYPNWMLTRHYPDAPMQLHILELFYCSSQLASIPKDSKLFMGLRKLNIHSCDWDCLPQNMECLVSLKTLKIYGCNMVEYLPTLPHQSLEEIHIISCYVLSKTCKEEGHDNWQKIQHIRRKWILESLVPLKPLCSADAIVLSVPGMA